MDKHTPGDWRVLDTRGSFKDSTLCVVAQPDANSKECVLVFEAGSADDEECQANARLGAAAKDLCEAGQDLRRKYFRHARRATSDESTGPVLIPRALFDKIMTAVDAAHGPY